MRRTSICISAGHGGRDPGAVGPGGRRESAVALSVAQMVRNRLEHLVAVYMTRDEERAVSLAERVAVANRNYCDLFLAIHCNAAPGPATGIETFYFRGSERGREFAARIQLEVMTEFPGRKNRGVKPAGYYVLRHTAMPAALVELEFIDEAEGEEFLGRPDVQARYADAIAQACLNALVIYQRLGGELVDLGPGPGEAHPWRQWAIKQLYGWAAILKRLNGGEER